MLRSLHIALIFMTTLPMPKVQDWRDDDVKQSLKAYPFVGLVVGLVLLLVFWLIQGFSDFVQAVLLLAAWLSVTGALHFDGFCDIADAVFASKSAEERQKITKDVSLGAFALAAGSVLLLLKVATLDSLDSALWLVLIPLLARTHVLIPMRLFSISSSSQLAKATEGNWSDVYLPLSLGISLSLILALFFNLLVTFLAILFLSFIFVTFLGFWLTNRMDGLSGDAYGSIIESSETLMLLVVSLL